MQDSLWLDKIGKELPKIQELALSCKEPFQQKCFELLLLATLQQEKSESQKLSGDSKVIKSAEKLPYTIEYRKFLEHFNLNHEKIANIMDFNSGKIYTKQLGNTVASRQRMLALLIALMHCAKEGNLIIPKEELRQQCQSFSSYDSNNFAATMRTTATNKNAIVFEDKGDHWKVTPPGEEYVKEMIAGILDNQ
jgi:hypothetical protein